jgi:hypothetical protein
MRSRRTGRAQEDRALGLATDCTVACLDTCRSAANPARYQPIRYGAHLLERLDLNHTYRKPTG